MRKTVVIVGNSQLSFFIAKQLSESIGNYAHCEIIWATGTERIYPVYHQPISVKQSLGEVEVLTTAVKGINLNDRRVVTGKKSLDYDLLVVDQTPVFTSTERRKITDQFETLISTIRSQENRGVSAKAKVHIAGKTADSYQLSLDLASRKLQDSSSAVSSLKLEAEPQAGEHFSDYMRENGVSSRKSQYPGLLVKRPLSPISSSKIRGLRVDLSGRAILLLTGEPTHHPDAIIIDDPERDLQNIARADWQLSKRVVANIVAKLEGGLERPIDQGGVKLILRGQIGHFLELGRVTSRRARARAVTVLEKQFWRRLFG